jgi:para-aminobenzoate synthetase/4-amino-4-deoxychorismate lyase
MRQNLLAAAPPSALVDFADPYGTGPRLRHAFRTPLDVLQASTFEQVRPLLDRVEDYSRQGFWCVGYLCYEAAPAFDPAFAVRATTEPLAWFAVYDKALPWPQVDADASAVSPLQWQPTLDQPAFESAFRDIQLAIARGDYYQVNFTSRLVAPWQGLEKDATSVKTAVALFRALQAAQSGGYAAFLDTGKAQILSVSPELFFDWQDGLLLTRPMKGTSPRRADPSDDVAAAEALKTSPKERAENVMIVDLLRNDVSRIAEPFSVKVPHLFQVQALPAVWQMTSDITARTLAGISLADIFAALFPCGSITGAPKVQAMRAIQALEPDPRGVYCGALGIIRPGGSAIFNVPIRTVTVHHGQAHCGIGSGITADALADDEWSEWQYKQSFVRRATTRFELLETVRLQDGNYQNLSWHLNRLSQAAQHFGYPWQVDRVKAALMTVASQRATGMWRVRLLLDSKGNAMVEAHDLPVTPSRVRLQLAGQPLAQSHSEFVRFKTTHRPHYDAFAPSDPDVFDTVLWNSRREITECTRGNILMELEGEWVTPPQQCGLLAGVGRAIALQEGRVKESVVTLDSLPKVTAIAFINSLRGWVDAHWDAKGFA